VLRIRWIRNWPPESVAGSVAWNYETANPDPDPSYFIKDSKKFQEKVQYFSYLNGYYIFEEIFFSISDPELEVSRIHNSGLRILGSGSARNIYVSGVLK
jgi:hypothetical protein